jgi:hypothetical protein
MQALGTPIGGPPAIPYAITVRRDVPSVAFYFIGLVLLLLPPLFGALRAASFEQQRWSESDYAAAVGGGDDDE